MTHYVKEKYNKKITLFSKDAVKTPDSSGSKYEWFSWNNTKNLGLLPDTKMKVGSIDFKNVPLIDVDIQAPVPPDDLVVHYMFDGDVVEEVQNTPTTIIGTAVYGVGKKFDNNAYFNASWACSIDAADNPLTSVSNAITICAWIKMDSLVREHVIRKELCYVIKVYHFWFTPPPHFLEHCQTELMATMIQCSSAVPACNLANDGSFESCGLGLSYEPSFARFHGEMAEWLQGVVCCIKSIPKSFLL